MKLRKVSKLNFQIKKKLQKETSYKLTKLLDTTFSLKILFSGILKQKDFKSTHLSFIMKLLKAFKRKFLTFKKLGGFKKKL